MMTKYHKNQIKRKLQRQLRGGKNKNNLWYLKFKTLLHRIPKLNVCENIAGIMPMEGPSGQVFYLNFKNHEKV